MYVKLTDGNADQYPYTVSMLRRDHPNTSFPQTIGSSVLESYGLYNVTFDDAPSIDGRTQKVTQNALPTLTEGQWVIGYTVENKSQEEIDKYDSLAATAAREDRDTRLAETDWWASSDLTMTAEQTAYRQALRDITTHANWPHLSEDDWPTKP